MANSEVARASKAEYVTDNPFRALSTGSGQAISSLRRKADAAAKAARVGLAPEVPLASFGVLPLEDLPSLIRGLVNDCERRTAFRIMWPLSESSISLLSDFASIRKGELPDEEVAQVIFLSCWYSYLVSGSPEDAAEAFARWEDLYSNEAMAERLAALLAVEEGLKENAASDVVLKAQRAVALAILSRVSTDAALFWDAGETTKGAQLVKAVLDSPIEDDLEERALAPVADSAHRLKERVERTILEMTEWHHGSSTEPPKEVVQLERIAGALKGRLPSARDWEETAHEWTTNLVWRMRQDSLRLNHADDNSAALEVTRAALKLANTTEQKAKLREDLNQLEKIVSDKNTEAAYGGIEKINSAPSLGTLNGFGLRVYGREPFSADRGLYFTVLYFTAVFIPIVPIARYLVKDGEGGGWHFFGKTRWTPGMKAHLGAFCLLILLFSVFAANSGSASVSESSSYSSATPPAIAESETTPSYTFSTTGSTMSTESAKDKGKGTSAAPQSEERTNIDYSQWLAERAAKEKKQERIEREMEELKAEIDALRKQISEEGARLDDQRSILNGLKAEIDASNPDTSSQEEIDAHNAKVRDYENFRAEFNQAVQNYNRKVDQEKRKVHRHNEIVNALNAGG